MAATGHSIEEIAARMEALGLWEPMLRWNWAIRPAGSVLPYFCTLLKGDGALVRMRLLLLVGWQTFHDFMRGRADPNWGFYSSPMELPHLELVFPVSGMLRFFRHAPGYMPVEASAADRALGERLLWQVLGLMMRLETDPKLPLRFAGEQAIFARIEKPDGNWEDAPLALVEPRPYVENVALSKDDLRVAKDLVMAKDDIVDVDFRMLPGLMTKETPPRCCYELLAVEASGGREVVRARVSISPDGGLKGLWESVPGQLLKALVRRGRFPGEIRVRSGRLFRLLRGLCTELPFRLSLHENLPTLVKISIQ